MRAKPAEQTVQDPPGSAGTPVHATDAPPPASDHDPAIERLERALADERQHALALRKTTEELRFKLDIQEKGYTKQLADARSRMTTAEQKLADHDARLAALGAGGEETLKLLADARAELLRVTADRDQLRKQLARNDGHRPLPVTRRDGTPHAEGEDLTINSLLALSNAPVEHGSVERNGRPHARAEQELPSEVMLAPELMFAPKRAKDDDETQ